MEGTNGNSRMDRIERALEVLTNSDLKLSDGLQSLAGSMANLIDVVTSVNKPGDNVQERCVNREQLCLRQRRLEEHLTASGEQFSERQRQLKAADDRQSECQARIDESLDALTKKIDQLIRKRPPQ